MAKLKKVSALLSADLHIRNDVPVCRTDDYFAAMERKIDFILDLSKKYVCPILVAGDIGDKSQWPNWLLKWAINKLEGHKIIVIPGQHDLPGHRLALWKKSGIGVLHAAEVITLLGPHDLESYWEFDNFLVNAFPYGEEIHHIEGLDNSKPQIAMAHQMVIENKELWPDQNAFTGHQLLRKFPEYSLILSGDNHQTFTAEYKGRRLVNPGSLMRSTAAQIDHEPCMFLWNAESNEIEKVLLPIEKDVINREHIDRQQEKDKRTEAYVTHLKKGYEVGLSFDDNMDKHFLANRARKRVKEKVYEAME